MTALHVPAISTANEANCGPNKTTRSGARRSGSLHDVLWPLPVVLDVEGANVKEDDAETTARSRHANKDRGTHEGPRPWGAGVNF